jgi:choline dehydrogenase-like flavoprotein
MIVDLARTPTALPRRAEIVVVGAGPAGIALARALSGSPFDVAVLESGGREIEEATAELGAATTSGEPGYPITASRVRALGGTTALWAGQLRPLDPSDLAARPWVAPRGWPVAYDELLPYYDGALEVLGGGPEPFDLEHWRPALAAADVPLVETAAIETVLFRTTQGELRMGVRHAADLEASPNVTTYLHATVVALVAAADGSGITAVDVALPGGRRGRLDTGVVVVATGGLEAPRLLLASRAHDPRGVGNGHDLVGRFFMEHPHVQLASSVWTGAVELFGLPIFYALPTPVGDRLLRGALTLPRALLEEERLPALTVTLAGVEDAPAASEAPAVEALVRATEGRTESATHDLFVRAEQRPHPDNRVTLGDTVDAYGVPRLHLHWEVHDDDRRDYARAMELLAVELGRAGLGRVRARFSSPETFPLVSGGHHHMGTARMDDDPALGVVDRDCRVHGVENLYVASSAVFPTCGHANPTLTIVALALRLADHLLAGTTS